MKLANVESKLTSAQGENHSLKEELSQLQSESKALSEKEEELKSRVEELEGELREARTTMETSQFSNNAYSMYCVIYSNVLFHFILGVDMAVREKQQENSEAMEEMEKLLSVARREHGKAVVQLQQLQRQLGRDRDRAMEAMKLNQTRLEQQLEACRKKLEASQVERNLLLVSREKLYITVLHSFFTILNNIMSLLVQTAVRHEGLGVAMKQRTSPRRRVLSDNSDREEENVADSVQSEGSQNCNGHSQSREESHSPTSMPSQTAPPSTSQTEGMCIYVDLSLWDKK